MSQFLNTLHTVVTDPHWHVLADDTGGKGGVVPDYTPQLPKEVNNPTKTILGWTAGIGLAAAVLGSLVAWMLVAVGHNTERASLAARGKQGVLWSLVGAGGIGVTSSLVLAFYNMAK
ncbi:hypothetical protein [Streptomyces violascens]|uniref:Integral membrane protein n=1 Tax=Streptomyces violascens TaxID=67381 RepID=A0ABQ3QL80_9ACTN|nr:hypothetical protein [Streptomyces violascens]GGU44651.1 hypothetical protein GCM10010289_76550 [Streptomyces violascens]GHI38026.1 hypothetical protein Sviol_24340 [Streptomyces violascens]